MIVAYDVSHIQTRRGGIGRYSLSLLQEMIRSGSDPRFILHGWSWSIDRNRLDGFASGRCMMDARRIPGIVKRAYWDRLRIAPLRMFTGHFDVFHSADPYFPPVGRSKVIVTVHDLLSSTHPQYFSRSIRQRDGHLALWVRKADAVVVPSRSTLEELTRAGIVPPAKIHLITPPLPDVFHQAPGKDDGPILTRLGLVHPYLLFVGTIEPRKNVQGIVDAFERVCTSGTDGIDLVIAGKLGWMSDDVPQRIMESAASKRIRWLQYVADEDLPALYRGAVAFVYPSFVEGYGLPVAEAMACGLPVITSSTSGTAEAAGGAAMDVDPFSPDEISRAMTILVNDTNVRDRLRGAGLERAAVIRTSFDPRSVRDIYEAILS